MRSSRSFFSGAAALACVAFLATPAAAQRSAARDRADAENRTAGNSLSVPGGEPIIQITADAPQEVRIGQSYDYQIQVKNVSQNIVVHQLVIAQHAPEKFEIQSSQLQAAEQSRTGQARSSQNERSQSAAKRQPRPQERPTQDQQQDQQGQSAQTGQGQSRWTIDKLKPGETRTISVTAISDSEGQGNVCIAIESYTPALCLTTKFTKPELEIVKQAPETVDVCEEIEFTYLVKNSGTGNLEQFTVEDQLPEGLQTSDGKKKLQFTLDDGLKAGEVRKFVAKLHATKTGKFSSRATVRAGEDLQAQSNNVTTRVQKPELAVAIDGPSAQQVDALANYTIRVTNRGEIAAPNTQLTLYFPRSADFVRATQPRQSSRQVSQDSSGSQASAGATSRSDSQRRESEADLNAQETSSQRDRQAQGRQAQGRQTQAQQAGAENQNAANRNQLARRRWDLGTLDAGQTVEVSFSLRTYDGGQIKQIAVAEYVCPASRERDFAKDMFRAEDYVTTEIVSLPGLRLTVIDSDDPVPTGEQLTYTIQVANEGNAKASDIQVSAHLPQGLEFVEASGDTNGKNTQSEVTFEPVQVLEPGESATWKVVVKVNEQADAAFRAEMTSAEFDKPVSAEEPTTLFDQGQNASQGQSKRQNQDTEQPKSQEQEQRKPAPNKQERSAESPEAESVQ